MEFIGRIQKVLPVRSGVSQRTGNEWKSLPFVFEYYERPDDRWSDKVLLETFDVNIMAQIGAYLKKGTDGKAIVKNGECVMTGDIRCKCGFGHSVRQFDRQDGTKTIVNDMRLYKFELAAGQHQPTAAAAETVTAPAPQQPQQGDGKKDDLPF